MFDRIGAIAFNVGSAAVAFAQNFSDFIRFSADCVGAALRRDSYNGATWHTIHRQIYFTAIQILPSLTLFTVILSWVITGIIDSAAHAYNLVEYETVIGVRLLAMELLPFLTAVLITLRSGSAINTEIALMRVNNELDSLRQFRIDPMHTEFMPRLISGLVSVTTLSVLSSLLSIVIIFFALNGLRISYFPGYSRSLVDTFEYRALFWWTVKCLLFGFCAAVIPMHFGRRTAKKMAAVPISVLRGMVGAFFSILIIEVGILVLTYM